jgi:ech hydrogenase subunit F
MTNPTRLPMARQSLRNLFSRPATRRYPGVSRTPVTGARGALQFELTQCNFCERCAKRCPTEALCVSRELRTLAFDELLCISCGSCVEVCTKHSLLLTEQPPPILAAADGDPRAVSLGRHEWHGAPSTGPPGARRAAARPDLSD